MADRAPRPLLKTTRRVTTLAVLVAAAYALLHLLPGGFGGLGDRDGNAPSTTDSARTRSDPQSTGAVRVVPAQHVTSKDESSGEADGPRESAGSQASQAGVIQGGVVHVWIAERDYFLEQATADGVLVGPASLETIVRWAQQAPGDSNGIRVLIQRRESARASAEHELLRVLSEQGIGADAVFMSSELTP